MLKQIKQKIKTLEKSKDEINKKLGKLQGQKMELVLKEIKTNGLKECPWAIEVDNCNRISLNADVKDAPNLEKFSKECIEFYYGSEHYEVILDSSEHVRFDDGEITIHFENINQCICFIEIYGISIDFSVLESNIRYYTGKLDNLKNILNMVKGANEKGK